MPEGGKGAVVVVPGGSEVGTSAVRGVQTPSCLGEGGGRDTNAFTCIHKHRTHTHTHTHMKVCIHKNWAELPTLQADRLEKLF